MPSPRPALALTLLAASGLAGCVDHSTQHPRDNVVRVTVTEFRVRPQDARVRAGSVTFVIHNAGRLAHDLRVRKGHHVLGGTRTALPGETCSGTVTIPAGSYRIFSSLHRDEALGISGQLRVKGSGGAQRSSPASPAPAQAGRSDRPSPNPAATDASGAGALSAKIQPCRSTSTATPSARSSAPFPLG